MEPPRNSSERILEPSVEEPIDDSPVREEFVTDFDLKQEVLLMFGIHVKEKLPHIHDITGTLEDPVIKDKMYDALVRELQSGSTYALDFMFNENLLSKTYLEKKGLRKLKDVALHILQNTKGHQRTNDKDLFINTGILTQEEARDAFYTPKPTRTS